MPASSTTADQVHAASEPIETSVSIVVDRCLQVDQRRSMERPARVEDHRCRQRGDDPFPTVESERRDHADEHGGHGKHAPSTKTAPEIGFPPILGLVGFVVLNHAVAESLDRCDEGVVLHAGFVHHRGFARRVVDLGDSYAVEFSELGFDPGRTCGAVHTVHCRSDRSFVELTRCVSFSKPSSRIEGQA